MSFSLHSLKGKVGTVKFAQGAPTRLVQEIGRLLGVLPSIGRHGQILNLT